MKKLYLLLLLLPCACGAKELEKNTTDRELVINLQEQKDLKQRIVQLEKKVAELDQHISDIVANIGHAHQKLQETIGVVVAQEELTDNKEKKIHEKGKLSWGRRIKPVPAQIKNDKNVRKNDELIDESIADAGDDQGEDRK